MIKQQSEGGTNLRGNSPNPVKPGGSSVNPGWYRPPFRDKLAGRASMSAPCTAEALWARERARYDGLGVWEAKVGGNREIGRLQEIRRSPRAENLGGGWFRRSFEVPA